VIRRLEIVYLEVCLDLTINLVPRVHDPFGLRQGSFNDQSATFKCARTMQYVSRHSQRSPILGAKAICYNHGPFHVHLHNITYTTYLHYITCSRGAESYSYVKQARDLGDCFREHLWDAGKKEKDASK